MKTKKDNFFLFYGRVLKESVSQFVSDNILTQSAALSYYTVFSLPPMLIVVFWAAGLMADDLAIQGAIFDEIGGVVGNTGSDQIQQTIEGMRLASPTLLEGIVGVGVLLFTSSTVLVAMQEAMDGIFRVEVKRTLKESIWFVIRDRLLSISMLITFAFIAVISLVFSGGLTSIGIFLEEQLGYSMFNAVNIGLDVLDFMFTALLFAIIFRYFPSVKIKWRDTWFGAILTALLFFLGKSLIEKFIGGNQMANLYEAAGSVLVLMLWVYYSSAIFLFGAVITYNRSKLMKKTALENDVSSE